MVRPVSEQPLSDNPDVRLRELERTLESLREDSEVAHVLLGLSGALAEVRTVEETLDKAVRIVRELFSADRCFAAAWDGVAERFKILAHFGFEPARLVTLQKLAARDRGGLPLLMHALTSRSPLLIPDVTADGRLPAEDARRRRLHAYIGIPLLRWGQDFGGLGIEFAEEREFTSQDMALARGIARQVGVALANARRFNLLQQLRGLGLKVGARLRLSSVASEIASGARDLLNGHGALLYFFDTAHESLVASGGTDVDEAVVNALTTIERDDAMWGELFQGRPVTVHDVRSQLQLETGPVSAVGTVIPAPDGGLHGAMVVFFDRYFTLGPDEAEALNVLAAQSASAIENAKRYERQRRVARSLQEGLLRTDLPKSDAFEVHATYEPASGEADVGGDYYDVFDFPDGRLALVVGDVSGKGAEAAAHTAMAKYMLRAFAIRNPGPSSVLFHLNNALVQGLTEDRFTTIMYALFDPPGEQLQMACGGHPEPLLYRAESGEIEVLRTEGSIVGAFLNQRFEQITVKVAPGDTLISFSDGLIDSRDENGELYGHERVIESFRKHAGLPAQDLTRALFEDARSFGNVTDDTVVFTLVVNQPAADE